MEFVTELLQDSHFWVGVAFVVFILILVRFGVHGMALKALDGRAAAIQAQLDEAARIREESEALLKYIQAQRAESEAMSAEMLASAQAEAKRLEKEAVARLAETIERRAALAERKIASAEAQAAADVKAVAADLAAQVAEQILAARIATAKSDPQVDEAIKTLATRLQ